MICLFCAELLCFVQGFGKSRSLELWRSRDALHIWCHSFEVKGEEAEGCCWPFNKQTLGRTDWVQKSATWSKIYSWYELTWPTFWKRYVSSLLHLEKQTIWDHPNCFTTTGSHGTISLFSCYTGSKVSQWALRDKRPRQKECSSCEKNLLRLLTVKPMTNTPQYWRHYTAPCKQTTSNTVRKILNKSQACFSFSIVWLKWTFIPLHGLSGLDYCSVPPPRPANRILTEIFKL